MQSSDIIAASPAMKRGEKKCFVKVVAIGDSGVGKTSLIQMFEHTRFTENFKPTIGADFSNKEITIDGKIVMLQIWDTAGQERYNSLTKLYFKGANAAIIVYDITDKESFAKAQRWSDQIDEFQQSETDAKIDKFVVGNKCDLASRQQVTIAESESYAAKIGACGSHEVSAKEGSGISELFKEIAVKMHE